MLIFGCRSDADDFYYKNEWATYPNLTVVTAFSRADPNSGKVYVQHKIREQVQLLAPLIFNE